MRARLHNGYIWRFGRLEIELFVNGYARFLFHETKYGHMAFFGPVLLYWDRR